MDDFSVFDAPVAPPPPASYGCSSGEVASRKRGRAISSLLPLVQRFVREHCATACADLEVHRATHVALSLAEGARCLARSPADMQGCRTAANVVDQLTWSQLQDGGWPHVCWREAFVLAQMMLCCVEAEAEAEREAVSQCSLVSSLLAQLQRCDRAFMLGVRTREVTDCIALLEASELPPLQERDRLPVCELHASVELVAPVERRERESLLAIYKGRVALLLEGGMKDWQHLRQAYGDRLVPVELGKLRSGQPNRPNEWGEKMMLFRDFIDNHLLPQRGENSSPPQLGYLAQHELFDQLTGLQHDFEVPRICSLGKLRHMNAWLGPAGTVTPCHYDSYDNIFAQERPSTSLTLAPAGRAFQTPTHR
ncbi:MAG: hypothetical protein SGPRY_009670, partial [Prymnesium sp.]